jgi:hypothetical protein
VPSRTTVFGIDSKGAAPRLSAVDGDIVDGDADVDVAADAEVDAETTDPVIATPVARIAAATRGRPLRCLVKMAMAPLTLGSEPMRVLSQWTVGHAGAGGRRNETRFIYMKLFWTARMLHMYELAVTVVAATVTVNAQ